MINRNRPVRGSTSGRPIMRLFDVMGKRWSMRIIWELRDDQSLTFRQLRERCDDVSPTSLNQRLKELRQLRLIEHDDNGYQLTQWGRELGKHLLGLNTWATRWDKAL
ncbi:MAG: helix-turn-helix domain-containing protein [Pseudomonadota bacterium]